MIARRLVLALAALSLTACGAGELSTEQGEELEALDLALTTNGRFELFTGRDGKSYFHLLAGNGEKVLSSQGYASERSAKAGVGTVNVNGTESSSYELRTARDGSSYFVLKAGNGRIIGVSQMYATPTNAARALNAVVKVVQHTAASASDAPAGERFETFRGVDGKYYFHLRAANGEIVLQSQAYASSSGARSGIGSVRTNGADARRYEVREAADGQHYFVLKAGNGRIIGRGEAYSSKANAEAGVETCAALLAGGEVR